MTAPDEKPPEPNGPPGQPYVSPDDLASIPGLWDEQVQRLLPVVAQIYADSAGRIQAGLISASKLPDLPGASSLAAETYLAQVQNVYSNIGDELFATAQTQLTEGFKNGESIDQLAGRLRASAGLTARNAELVARSTVVEASNAGSIQTARATGLDMRKKWINTPDGRTRPAHRDEPEGVGGQIVPLDGKFTVGGYEADAPGDPMLPAALKYRCRCTIGYVFDDEDQAAGHEQAHQERQQVALPNTTPPTAPAPSIVDQDIADNPTGTPEQQSIRRAAAQARIIAARPRPTEQGDLDEWEIAQTTVARDVSTALSALDEITANGASTRAVRARMKSAGLSLHPDIEAKLADAGATGDRAQVQQAISEVADRYGLTRFSGAAGERSVANPEQYEDLTGARIPAGTLVDVIRPGYSATIDGRPITAMRAMADRAPAVVEQAGTPSGFALPPKPAAPTLSEGEKLQAARRAQRQAARETSRAVEAAKPYAELGAHVAQATRSTNMRWTAELGRTLTQQADYAEAQGVPAAELERFRAAIKRKDAFSALGATDVLADNHGLTQIGIQGREVAFNAARMEPLAAGTTIDDGALVQVVRPGYDLRLPNGGQLPALTRAIVKPAAKAVGTETPAASFGDSIKAILPDSKGNLATKAVRQQAYTDIGRAFEGQFGNLRTARIQVTSSPRGDFGADVYGEIVDGNGSTVGNFYRQIHPPYGGQAGWVSNELLQINRASQGSGFAAQFNASMFDQYRAAGFKFVQTHANVDVGGYTWAAQGFDFATPKAAVAFNNKAAQRLEDWKPADLQSVVPGLSLEDAQAQIEQFRQLLIDQANGEQISAYTFSQLGRPAGAKKLTDLWLGKVIMLSLDWEGRLPL